MRVFPVVMFNALSPAWAGFINYSLIDPGAYAQLFMLSLLRRLTNQSSSPHLAALDQITGLASGNFHVPSRISLCGR